jgi:hypothetical protein
MSVDDFNNAILVEPEEDHDLAHTHSRDLEEVSIIATESKVRK